jgi:hypothetical protein
MPRFVAGAEREKRLGAFGVLVVVESVEAKNPLDGDSCSFAVASLSLGHSIGELWFGARGRDRAPMMSPQRS